MKYFIFAFFLFFGLYTSAQSGVYVSGNAGLFKDGKTYGDSYKGTVGYISPKKVIFDGSYTYLGVEAPTKATLHKTSANVGFIHYSNNSAYAGYSIFGPSLMWSNTDSAKLGFDMGVGVKAKIVGGLYADLQSVISFNKLAKKLVNFNIGFSYHFPIKGKEQNME